ncbi:MAG: hypothetical protein JWO19_1498 [Bryobacterales bacterium]|nr:hypothetical protein [Bryobacterales bacterium]
MKSRSKTIGDLVSLQRGHDLTENERKEGIVPIIGSAGQHGLHNVARARGPGVTVGRSGGSIGKVTFVEQDYWPHNTCIYVTDFKGNDPRFVAYLLGTINLAQLNSGAAQPSLNRNFIYKVPISFPDTPIQSRIAAMLAAYDDLIENNRRRIRLLEEAAQMLFREWFIRFRFPGHEHVTVMDGVPEGWKKHRFGEIIDVNPFTPIDKSRSVTYVPMAALSTSGMSIDNDLLEERNKATTVRFTNGDTLLARITPSLENGKTAFVNFLRDGESACGSTEFIVLRGTQVSSFFVYCLARTERLRGTAIKSMTGASGRQRVQESCFNDFIVPKPPTHLLDAFDDFASSVFREIRLLTSTIDRLRTARDLLLPKLMSGEVEV